MDLDVDRLRLITQYMFEDKNVKELMQLTWKSKTLHFFINEIARKKWSNKEVTLIDSLNTDWTSEWKEFDDRIEVKYSRSIVKFLENFGPLISKLKIEIFAEILSDKQKRVDDIFHTINLYCSETLLKLDILIKIDTKNTFNSMRKPFSYLNKLSLEGYYDNVTNFNELFLISMNSYLL